MHSTSLPTALLRPFGFDNLVGITLKSALWQAEPSPAVWKRIRHQLDARKQKEVMNQSEHAISILHQMSSNVFHE